MARRPIRLASALALLPAVALIATLAFFATADARAPVRAANGGVHAPDHFLVKFAPGTPRAEIDAVNRANGVVQVDHIRQIDVRMLVVPPGKTVDEMVQRYSKNPNVEFAEPDYAWELETTPNDERFFRQTQSLSIGLPYAWEVTVGRADVIVAVLDSGVDMTHPDLRLVAGYDFGDSDPDPSDENGHGTAVAGVAAETGNNTIGYAGVNWVSPVMPVKVGRSDGTISTSAVAAGLIYAADQGARVINMSFSGPTYSSSVKSAVDYALGRGLFLCAATGNTSTEVTRYPAGYPGVVGVGSMSASSISSFSTYGSCVDVVAPGEGIGTTCLPKNSPYGDRYFFFSGTSASSPYVAGLASLLFSADPSLTGSQVADIIRATCTDFGDPGWDKYYGWGRIDAAAALTATGVTIPAPEGPPDVPGEGEDPETPSDPESPTVPVPPQQPADSTPPSVTLISPLDGAAVSKTVTLRAEAEDESGIDRVEFYANGVLLGASLSAPYTWNWNVRKLTGDYVLTALALDAYGNRTESAPVTVTIGAAKTPPPKH